MIGTAHATGKVLALRSVIGLAVPAAGQTFVQRLNAGAETKYGFAVATEGNRVAVGELFGLTGAVSANAVEVWRLQDGAMLHDRLLDSDFDCSH